MFNFIRKKLIYKFIIVLILVVFVISGITFYYVNRTSSKMITDNLESTLNYLTFFTKKGYSLLLYNLDDRSIDELNKALILNENIVAINVYNEIDFFTGIKKEDLASIPLSKPFKVPERDNKITMISQNIYFQDIFIGKLEVFYTREYIDNKIKKQLNEMIITYLLLSLITVFFLYFILKRYIIRPILYLSDFSSKIAKSNHYSLRLEKYSNDEIGALIDGFNNMLGTIELRDNEIKKTRSYLNNIIESMPSMLISLDENNVVTQWNHSAVINTGIPSTEIIGKKITDVTPLFDNYILSTKEIIEKRIPHFYHRQHLNEDDDNLKDISLYPLITNGVKGLVLRVDDVTEIEKKDETIRQMQKMETVGTLAGGLAHDFNNVLGGVVGIVSIIQYKMANDGIIDRAELTEYINIIDQSGKRAMDMVQQLLALSKKYDLVLITLDLNTSVRNVIKLCRNSFDKCVEIDVSYFQEKALYDADPTQIEQVILNLCINAYHSMTLMRPETEKKGGVLTVRIEKIIADKYFCNNHPEAEEIEYLRLMIGDTGIGMDSKTIAKMFEPFFTMKEKGKGTGLGLSMVYNIVKQHNGFLDVYSEIGIGTTVSVYFPFTQKKEEAGDDSDVKKVYKGEGLILVIDDESVMRNIAKTMLEDCNYRIIYAEDGLVGLEKYKIHQDEIKLVLLDMIMPRMSGEEVYKEIKKINPEVKVLLTSGFMQDDRVQKVMNCGVNGFIQKPYTIEKLSKAIYDTINKRD